MRKFIKYTVLSMLICLGQLETIGQPPPSVSVTLLQDGGCQFPYITSSGFFSGWWANSNSNWQSTDGSVEVWESGAHGYTGYEGTRFTEVNVFGPGTLSQQFSSPGAGVITTVKFAHRGRPPYTNTMRVSIGPVGGSYTTLGDYTTGHDGWVLYSANYTFPSTGNYEIRFQTLSPTVDFMGPFPTNPEGRGNFLDAVSISTSAINTTVSGGTSTTAFITPFTTTCAGSASAPQSFPVSGKSLTANLVVTAPTGYEVSLSSGSGYGSSVSITQTSGTVESTDVWVRLSSSASNGASGNVTVTSTGAVTQNVATGTGTVVDCPMYWGGSSDGAAMAEINSPEALPVTWLDFTGEQVKGLVRLDWQTASEQNSSHFEIERSANGGDYTRIGSMKSAGNSANIRRYEFTDETAPTGLLLYRLRQVDIDGRFSYSKIVQIRNTAQSEAKIGPNPTGGAITLQIPAEWKSNVEWRLYNTQGHLLEQRTKMGSGNYTLDLSKRSAGTYQLTLWRNGELVQKEWIIRQ